MSEEFQPTLLGTIIGFEDEDAEGMITDETPTHVFVQSDYFREEFGSEGQWVPKDCLVFEDC